MMQLDWQPIIDEMRTKLLEGDSEAALALTRRVIGQGAAPADFFAEAITPAMVEIGGLFETLEIFLPEMVVAAEIVHRINDEIIQPMLLEDKSAASAMQPLGKVALATIQGDLHDIGKNMVALLLRVNGFEVVDLGIDVPPAVIVDRASEEKVDIIGLSSLLTTCLPYMKDTLDLLHARGLRDQFKVLAGGAAPTESYAAQIGLDGVGHSAAEAVRLCKDIMAQKAD